MYAYLAIATGWTWEYIGEFMTLPRLFAMYAEWAKYPPVHVSMAAFAGTAKKPEAIADERAKTSWMASMPQKIIKRAK